MSTRITALKQDNETEWQAFFEANRGAVYCICLKYVKNHDDALDLTQQAFVNFFESLHNIRSSPLSYLKAIARNLSINFIRSRSGVDMTEDMDSLAGLEGESAAVKCLDGSVQYALSQLDEYCRAFIYYLSEGFKIREIARAFNADEGKVRSDSARCRRKAIYALYNALDCHDMFTDREQSFMEHYFRHAYWPREKVKNRMGLSETDFTVMLGEILRKLEAHGV